MPQMYLDLSAGDILNPCWEGDKVVDVVATFFPFTYQRIFWHTVFRIQKRWERIRIQENIDMDPGFALAPSKFI